MLGEHLTQHDDEAQRAGATAHEQEKRQWSSRVRTSIPVQVMPANSSILQAEYFEAGSQGCNLLQAIVLEFYGREERMILPSAMVGLKTEIDEDDDKNVRVSGNFGSGNGTKSVDVEVENGDIIITLEEEVPYTTKQRND